MKQFLKTHYRKTNIILDPLKMIQSILYKNQC